MKVRRESVLLTIPNDTVTERETIQSSETAELEVIHPSFFLLGMKK